MSEGQGPNHALRRARERLPSSRIPGCPMSRDELARLVNAWLRAETGRTYALDERAIGRWERGTVRMLNAAYRAALRAVLGVDHDRELGFGRHAVPVTAAKEQAPPTFEAIREMATSVHAADRRYGGGRL